MDQRLIIATFCLLLAATFARAEVTAERSERGVVFKIDGQLFTEYLTRAGHAPAMWPIIGPTGKPMTRAYPLQDAPPGGTVDHPHHQSLWVAYDEVNDARFWGTNKNDDAGDSGPHVAHREFVEVESGGEAARVVTKNDWMDGAKRICQDERTVACGMHTNGDRWIDYSITITASNGDVQFHDTKEGMFAVRVADSMRVEAKPAGHIVNSEGQENEKAWGLPARWVDYTGPIDGETVGIAIFSHPKSFRPVPRWHVRTYGLFAANPIGQKDFPQPDAAKQGPFTLKKGDSVTFRYRVLLHRGATDRDKIEHAFQEFAQQ